HVRHAALPAPGGEEALKTLASRLFAQRLDRDRPLWELYLIEGLAGGRFAVLSKTHHCMVDGVSGVDLGTIVLDAVAASGPPPAPRDWAARPAPSRRALVGDAVRAPMRRAVDLVRGALTPKSEARNTLSVIAGGMVPMLREAAQARRTPESSLNQPIGPHRRYEMLSLDLASVKFVGASLGGKVNDVVLAVVAGGLRRVLAARGEVLDEDLRVMVPVNVRRSNEVGTIGNHVALFICPLPVRCADAATRLRTVAETMAALKKSKQLVGSMAFASLSDFAFPPVAAPATRFSSSLDPWFNLVVTNVPGPQVPLYLLGRKLLRCHPLVPLAPRQTLGIALLSYNGSLDVGLLGDADRARDLPDLAEAMKRELAELVELATRPRKAVGTESTAPSAGSDRTRSRKAAHVRTEAASI
ncbi:MAG TPA: wax ester/triacylglycerol synthase family O-acyltransferase, partial [Polyangiaceae bacterium]|nr:wax ester/triacylglycerol synthase family O-acyltransferase [Polyangiaceae bacterium]